MKRVELNKGMVALVDDEDFADLCQFSWYVRKNKHLFYAQRSFRMGGQRYVEQMHRRILKVGPGQRVDHRNHNGLDNQKHNLRPCTQSQNNANQAVRSYLGKSSRFKGVYWNKKRKGWSAQITLNWKCQNLGCFLSEEDAARAYDRKAIELFGEYACLNFTHNEKFEDS